MNLLNKIDFTLTLYQQLLESLKAKNYQFLTVAGYFSDNHSVASLQSRTVAKSLPHSLVLLRHDVDRKPENSLCMAKLEAALGIKATYYFRTISKTFKPEIIKEIVDIGHEIGYHYENITTCKGNMEAAIDDFQRNLEKLRKIAPVSNICMHGSPRSKWDSRDLWKKYDYRDYGIIGEPYFDIDFDDVFYLTDTGRQWDGWKVSVRDKLPQQEKWIKEGQVYHSTHDIIHAIEEDRFPKKFMMTFHPQRWTDKPLPWLKELLMQNVKNVAKGIMLAHKSRRETVDGKR